MKSIYHVYKVIKYTKKKVILVVIGCFISLLLVFISLFVGYSYINKEIDKIESFTDHYLVINNYYNLNKEFFDELYNIYSTDEITPYVKQNSSIKDQSVLLYGTTNNFLKNGKVYNNYEDTILYNKTYIEKLELLEGRVWTSSEVNDNVIIIEEILAKQLYGSKKKSINKEAIIDGDVYKIIGVVSNSKVYSAYSENCGDKKNSFCLHEPVPSIYLPYQKLFNTFNLDDFSLELMNMFVVNSDKEIDSNDVESLKSKILRPYGNNIVTREEQIKTIYHFYKPNIQIFSIVGGIFFFIGLLSITNFFLFRIKERKNESYIRYILGAKKINIFNLIFLEGFIISIISTVLAFGISLVISYLVSLTWFNYFKVPIWLTISVISGSIILISLTTILPAFLAIRFKNNSINEVIL